jgi:exonuclease SbcC
MINLIEINNFCTIDSATLDLSNQKLVMIVGGSGSGKSLLLGSIFACLYGSYPDKPDNSLYRDVLDAEKEASIVLELDLNNKFYRIERLVNAKEQKTLSYVYDNQHQIIIGPQLKGVQEWVTENIMDKNAFLSLYYLSQKSKQDICDLPPSESNKVILQLLGIGNLYPFTKHFSLLNKDIQQNIGNLKRNLLNIGSYKADLEKNTTIKQDRENDIRLLEKEIRNIDLFLETTHDMEGVDFLNKLKDQKTSLSRRSTMLDKQIKQNGVRKDELEGYLKATNEVPCKKAFPTCKFLMVDEWESNIKAIEKDIQNLHKEVEETDQDIEKIQQQIIDIQGDEQYNIHAKRLLSVNERDNYIQILNSKNKELGAIEGDIERLEREIAKELIVKNEIKILEKSRKYSEFLARTFSREGVPSIVIEQALPEINNIANDICINNYISFRFRMNSFKEMQNGTKVDNINVALEDENGKVRHVGSFSGGERQLAQVVLRFALQQYLSKSMNSGFSIFMGDEIWSQMDANSTELCFNIISSKSEFDQILVISHSYDLVSKFDCIIEVTKNNFTTFKVV